MAQAEFPVCDKTVLKAVPGSGVNREGKQWLRWVAWWEEDSDTQGEPASTGRVHPACQANPRRRYRFIVYSIPM